MPHDRFKAERNVADYRDRLLAETDGTRQAMLVKLLVAEEDRLAFSVDQFAKAHQFIGRCDEHIARLRDEIRRLRSQGRNPAQEEALLTAYTGVRDLHEQYCERIRLNLTGSGL
jgi:hypothetical protein